MLRLQAALEANGGNINDLGDSSDYSESIGGPPGGPPPVIQKNKNGVMIGSAEKD